ncbi:hypothetical protein SASPL_115346 [Salvia splendens]|uniref:RCC1-like domain-containing protein n=1 Tax=Salvia splendens TaxID=180675 RepID=A0A8X8Y7T6_SALSN|nr:hypothetical protein SASPL_115346 [Salvia splendens]
MVALLKALVASKKRIQLMKYCEEGKPKFRSYTFYDDTESLGGEILYDEIIDGAVNPNPIKNDVLTPKVVESHVVLDVQQIACGVQHIALVTRQGEVFTWGEESGGRLGHGIEKDFSRPRLVEFLALTNIEFVACGEFHTSALSKSGDLYTWGDGTHNVGLLGHGKNCSHWIPKRVSGTLESLHVTSVACGTWHSAVVTSTGSLFTFGDGTFGALGHGDHESVAYPKEVQSLRGLKSISVSCGAWHTAAIIETTSHPGVSSSRKLFTWGHVFTMGSTEYGQLGDPQSDGKRSRLVQDTLVGQFVEQISCGTYHVAVLTGRNEVFTWGKGANGRLGHGDLEDRNVPTMVEALKDRHVRSIVCGSNYTASICIHRWVAGPDLSFCTACKQAFGSLENGMTGADVVNGVSLTRRASGSSQPKDRRVRNSSQVLLPSRVDPVRPHRNLSLTQYLFLHSQANSAMSMAAIDSLQAANEILTQQVSKLHNQVKSLKQKTDTQDTEIQKLKKTAQETTSLAAAGSSKMFSSSANCQGHLTKTVLDDHT